ncbi:MAG: TlpA disulfide reductase family protein [Bergeyella sp.]
MKFLQKNALYLVLIAILAIIAFVPGLKLKVRDMFFPVAEIESAVTIPEADFDIELKGINTPSTNLKNLKSDKLLFLNFWGTWCPPCREEWPTIEALYNGKKNKVNFVLIAMQDEEEKVVKFLKDNHYTAPVYIAQSPISNSMLPKVFPTTFLINSEGRILLKEDSSKDWNSRSVNEFIDNVTP